MGSILTDMENHFKEVHPTDLLKHGWQWCVTHDNKNIELHKQYILEVPGYNKKVECQVFYNCKKQILIITANPFLLEPGVAFREFHLQNPSMPDIEAAMNPSNIAKLLYHKVSYYDYA